MTSVQPPYTSEIICPHVDSSLKFLFEICRNNHFRIQEEETREEVVETIYDLLNCQYMS